MQAGIARQARRGMRGHGAFPIRPVNESRASPIGEGMGGGGARVLLWCTRCPLSECVRKAQVKATPQTPLRASRNTSAQVEPIKVNGSVASGKGMGQG